MVKLGERDLPTDNVKDIEEDSASSEDEVIEEMQTPQHEEKCEETKEDIIPEAPQKKPKRSLTDKQRAALERGRAKKLKINLQSKMKKIQDTTDKLEQLPASPPKLKRTKHVKKAKKQATPPPPTPSESSDTEIETDEEIEQSDEKDVERLIEKYLESHMKKQASKERTKRMRSPSPKRSEPVHRHFNCRFL